MTPQPRAPTPEGLNLEFYEHAASGMLHLQQCTECGRFRHPPRYYCPYCFSPSYRWTPSAGAGRLFSWTITHFPFDRGWAEDLPYVTVVVELEEGTRVIGAFDGDADADLRVGLDLVATVDIEAYGFPFLRFARP
jgi:uncharacterized OB-fold protein